MTPPSIFSFNRHWIFDGNHQIWRVEINTVKPEKENKPTLNIISGSWLSRILKRYLDCHWALDGRMRSLESIPSEVTVLCSWGRLSTLVVPPPPPPANCHKKRVKSWGVVTRTSSVCVGGIRLESRPTLTLIVAGKKPVWQILFFHFLGREFVFKRNWK